MKKEISLLLIGAAAVSALATPVQDTTFHTTNGNIYTITTYEDSVLSRYDEFYSNGKKKYFINYYHENDTLRKETVHRGVNGREYAYGEYYYSDSGYTYDYYSTTGKQISSSDYSLWGYILEYRKVKPKGTIHWYSTYQYNDEGWLTDQHYFDSEGTLTAEAQWNYDSSSAITTYHYRFNSDSTLYNSYTGDSYDEYFTYYSSSLAMKDSTVVFNDGNRVYKAEYQWNENGYMTADYYYNSSDSLTSEGSYTFNSADYSTKYTYRYVNDSTRWETTSDYRGLDSISEVFSGSTLLYKAESRYNDLLYVDSVIYSDELSVTGIETYNYHEPYEWIKEYLYRSVNGDTLSYVLYDESGAVISSTPNSSAPVVKRSKIIRTAAGLHLSNIQAKSYSIFSVNGKQIVHRSLNGVQSAVIPTARLARGVYLLNVQGDVGSEQFRFIAK